MGTSLRHQVNLVYDDITNGTRNGSLKVIPAPLDYKPPQSEYYYKKIVKKHKRLKDIV